MTGFAYLFQNTVLNPAEVTAAAVIHEYVVDGVPTPHIWYLSPSTGNRGDVITAVGHGFGSTAVTYEGMLTLNQQLPPIVNWWRVTPSAEALSSGRTIDSLNDTADPEHDRIDFQIPLTATSGDVKVLLNAQDAIGDEPAPGIPIGPSGDTASAVESEALFIPAASAGLGQQVTGT